MKGVGDVALVNEINLDTFVETEDINIKELYEQYVNTYKKINKHHQSFKSNEEIKGDERINQLIIISDAKRELLEVIYMLEKYLPYEERHYTQKDERKLRKLTFDLSSVEGIIFEDDIELETPEDFYLDKEVSCELDDLLQEILTEQQYRCIKLYYWGGYNQEEVAKTIGIERSVATKHIQNSITKIRNSNKFLKFIKKF